MKPNEIIRKIRSYIRKESQQNSELSGCDVCNTMKLRA